MLRDGGRLSFSVWADPDRNPWAAIPGRALVQHGHMPAPRPGAPGIFAMADGKRIEALLGAARLRLAADSTRSAIEWRFRRPRRATGARSSSSMGRLRQVMEGLDERDRAQVCRTIEHKADRYRETDGELRPAGRRAERGRELAARRRPRAGCRGRPGRGRAPARTAPTAAGGRPAGRGPSARTPRPAGRS